MYQSLSFVFVFFLVFSTSGFSFPVEISNAPSSNLTLTLRAIKSAKQSLFVNIYEFSSPDIASAIVEQIQKGVHVEILEEGQPVGGMSEKAKGIEATILDGMNAGTPDAGDRFFIMKGQETGERRYHFDHAKYIVIDNESLLIGSENYSPIGRADGGSGRKPGMAGLFARAYYRGTVQEHVLDGQ